MHEDLVLRPAKFKFSPPPLKGSHVLIIWFHGMQVSMSAKLELITVLLIPLVLTHLATLSARVIQDFREMG